MRQIRITALTALSLALLVFAPAPEAGVGLAATARSADGIWETIDNNSIATADWQPPDGGSYKVLRLNKEALAQLLARAPMERTGDLRQSPAILSLPMPDGSFARFHIEESPVMDAELVALYPQIKSYRGQGIDDLGATVRFDWSPYGFHALMLSKGQPVSILPPNQNDLDTYASFFDARAAFECAVNDQHKINPGRPDGPGVAVGPTLRTYRLVVAATNEYCVLLGGNTAAVTVASINTFLNGANAIYERELSVHMNLVNAPTVIYAGDTLNCGGVACTGANDPYTNGNANVMLGEVRPDLDTKVGPANYDIGHVLGTNSGGVAFLGVVCMNGTCNAQPGACKGGGVSGMTAPAGNAGSLGLWAHELGHQFGATHTFNGTNASCGGGNREAISAYEPGSGTTIMSYAGICTSDNVSNDKDLRFHSGSFAQMSDFITNGGGAACAASTATGNNSPTVNAGTPFTIPRNTPFTLTATGTDADPGDVANLTFVWEQFDAGGALYFNPPYGDQAGDPPTTTRPLFRVFPPIAGKTRTFPSLTYILNNANVPPALVGGFQSAESLPAVSRTMNFRVTARDNRAGFGGVNDSSVATTVDGNSGPFAVTAPNGGGTLSGAQNVTWSVNNTNLAPVSCANVKISLSTDGGLTFPIVLAATTANTGTAGVTLPNGIASTTARVKVEGLGNIFFDISDANFTIVPADTCPAVSNISPQAGNVGSTVTITGVNFMNGGNVTGVKFTNNVTATFLVANDITITATVPAGAVGGPLTISKTACPDVQTANYTVCPNAPTALAIDDGGVETASSNGNGFYYVNRLTPVAYPATLTQVAVFWDPFQNFPPGTAINVVAGGSFGGTANIDGTSFQTFAATAGAQPGFTTYTLPNPLTIAAGDFVVGFQAPTVGGGSFPIAIDSNAPASRSYRSGNGTTFTNVTNGNYMIRAAQVFTACNSAPTPTPTATPPATPTPSPTGTPIATPTPTPTCVPGSQVFNATLNGAQEVPPTGSAAGGSGIVVLNQAQTMVTVNLNFAGLAANASMAHIHGPGAPGVNAPILITLAGFPAATSGTYSNSFAIAPATVTLLQGGLCYLNIHNGTFPNGEIRGQLTAFSCPPIGTPTPTPTPTPSPTPGLVANVSTRLPVGTGDDVLIEGFIVQGPAGSTKKIIVRALGPSLIPFGIADALANPTLEIRDAANAVVATNNDWRTTQVGGLITGDQVTEINTSGLAPTNDLESAIIASLVPGSYTAVVRGVGNTIGTGVVDAFDLSAASPARLANIATRGLIQPGDRLMIAGFIIQNGPVRAVVRAIGPSLVAFGITNALPDTTLQLRDQSGTIVLENDDWRTAQEQELINTGLQPTDNLEAALVTTLQPGSYTAQVRGKNNASGIGVVQVYFLQ